MTSITPANFLNLDLELESRSDLTDLAEYFGEQVFVLANHKTEHGFRLALEPLIEGRLNADPIQCTEHFIRLLNCLPENLADTWSHCTSRVFDFGFDGGNEAVPYQTTIPAALLEQIAKLDAAVRITIYPYREEEPGEE